VSGGQDLIGGHPAIDLVNTVSWRLDPARRSDRLTDGQALLDWVRRSGVVELVPAPGFPYPAVLERARALREDLHAVLSVVAGGEDVDPARLTALRDIGAAALLRARSRAALPLRFAFGPARADDIPEGIALSVLDLLVLTDLSRVRRCADDTCGWLYLDRSRNHSRRWCSSADCGNRHRVQQFAARARRSR